MDLQNGPGTRMSALWMEEGELSKAAKYGLRGVRVGEVGHPGPRGHSIVHVRGESHSSIHSVCQSTRSDVQFRWQSHWILCCQGHDG